MATERIDPKLIAKLQNKLGLKERAVYLRISSAANRLSVSNRVAALAVAQEAGVPFNRHGSPDEVTQLRQARLGQPYVQAPIAPRAESISGARRQGKAKTKPRKASKSVFIVHGRNERMRKAMFEFIRSVGLNPLEWGTLMNATGVASPYIGQVLHKGLSKATAVVVLMTPDDVAQLKQEFWSTNDQPHERVLTGQARPNVLFEAGLAFMKFPTSTILVQAVGRCRPFSDIDGRHIVNINNSPQKREELFDKLKTAGCPVGKTSNWLTAGDFDAESPVASVRPQGIRRHREKIKKKKKKT
jgi:predicted nucleotide-binding protein